MFHTLITIAYILPNIYLFFRIRKIFINKGYRKTYSLIYLLIVLVYPVSNSFSHSEISGIVSNFVMIGNYLLTFYLYLFLFVLVFDIFLIINRLFKVVPPALRESTRFKKISLSAILFFSMAVVIAGAINFSTIRTTEYCIEIPGRSSKISRLKVAFVADFHIKERTNINLVKRFVKEMEIIQPDLLLYGGDIVEGNRQDNNMIEFEKLLNLIEPKYGVYTVLGNHEFYAGQDKGSFFDKAGIKVLCDTIVLVDNSINLGGRYDSHFRTRKSIEELMQSSIDTLPVIIIDHRPTEIDRVSKTRIDIQLSGHTHNGQLFPVNLIIRSLYQITWGHKKIGNTHFFVTSGIQLWGPPVRTAGKAEIMVIDITLTNYGIKTPVLY
jgi:uncharacterized protein